MSPTITPLQSRRNSSDFELTERRPSTQPSDDASTASNDAAGQPTPRPSARNPATRGNLAIATASRASSASQLTLRGRPGPVDLAGALGQTRSLSDAIRRAGYEIQHRQGELGDYLLHNREIIEAQRGRPGPGAAPSPDLEELEERLQDLTDQREEVDRDRAAVDGARGQLERLGSRSDQGPRAIEAILQPIAEIRSRYEAALSGSPVVASPHGDPIPSFGNFDDIWRLARQTNVHPSWLSADVEGTAVTPSDATAPHDPELGLGPSVPSGSRRPAGGTGETRFTGGGRSGTELVLSSGLAAQLAQAARDTQSQGRMGQVLTAWHGAKQIAKLVLPEFAKVTIAFWAGNFVSSAITPHTDKMSEDDRKLVTDLVNGLGIAISTANAFAPEIFGALRSLSRGEPVVPGKNKMQMLGHAGMTLYSMTTAIVSAKYGDPAAVSGNAIRTQLLIMFRTLGSLPIETKSNRNSHNIDGIMKALSPALPYLGFYLIANQLVGLPHSYTGSNSTVASHSPAENLINTLGPSILYGAAEAAFNGMLLIHELISDAHVPDPEHRKGRDDLPNPAQGGSVTERLGMKIRGTEITVGFKMPSKQDFLDSIQQWGPTSNFFMAAFNLQPIANKAITDSNPNTLAGIIKANSPANPESAAIFATYVVFYLMANMKNVPDSWKFAGQ